jgi:RNA polymerase sigma-70 factor (ECF subfamily)
MMSDDSLATRAVHDPAAFTELYQRHVQRVYAYHLARTGGVPEAQDLTSQTFMAALEAIGRYRGSGAFAAWLFGIARNKLADYYRSRKPALPLDEVIELPNPQPSLEESTNHRLQLSQIANALHTLTPDRAEALTLRIFGGLSAAETARLMGKTEPAVKMLVHRALQDLKAILMTEDFR